MRAAGYAALGALMLTMAPVNAPAQAGEAIVVEGLAHPMAARFDETRDRYLVSNAPVAPPGRKAAPFISAITPDGTIAQLKWIESGKRGARLVSPKGMAIRGDELLVADLDRIRVFDATTGAPRREITVAQATNLADLTVLADGTVLAVDPGRDLSGGAVFRIIGDRTSVLVQGPHLWRPTSIAQTADGRVLIGPSIGGTIFVLGTNGQVAGYGQLPAQRLQPTVVRSPERIGGIVVDGDRVLASSWESGRIGVTVLDRKPAIDWDATRRIKAMKSARSGPAADGLDNPDVQAILQQPTYVPTPRGVRPRPPIAWPEAPRSDFVWTGLTTPNKMDVDRKRGRLIVPELTADRITIVPLAARASADPAR